MPSRRATRRSLVPAPPDAPQPKGQLLDFIEALKKRRPAFCGRKKARPAAAAPATPPPAPSVAPARQPASAQFGLGYGPPRERGRQFGACRRGQAVAAMPLSVERPRAGGIGAPRAAAAAARARLARAVAAMAVAALQAADRPGHRRPGRGLPGPACRRWRVAAPTSCRARPRTWRRSPASLGPSRHGDGHCRRRPGALDRLGRRRRHAQGVERGVGRAGAHHRARRRRRHGARRRPAARADRPQGRRRGAVGPGAAPRSSPSFNTRRRRSRRWPSPAIPTNS